MRHFHLGRLFYLLVAISLFLLTFSGLFDHRFIIAVLALVWIPVAWDAFKDLKEKKIGSELFFVAATLIALLGDEEQTMTGRYQKFYSSIR
ncbi:hypothetical protein AUK04_00010 [Candidatus Roizmanbacteria bacterium CG2_30_33_16]|uniref:Uncharacterized protein n=4 Tax=Candidatus Roizmaniibacteriota TaxID=1752723 RepID=A0A2M7E411_9BACT|nr:hypothetical protein [Candidatus Roizmanbacteria bacterium]OIP86793.1 MAG: hypothetical protein AUK04_00010 [Candidatus Roizmanbacteria bacterium CG2_30_33_16]PIP64089.1 MAG: hypothetical protein COW96_04535 [Candidatus Roizmanbacteria bacterium CG22_combo_CG10-13_8_21_14_all_33_16]PIV62438.1 MAG: hypothetical protein COS12_02410 [Candidatus Roizmanbacteria bacterium CG01_land_8_20_14_3_00_33_9]PIX74432.1 MAG: hypothetical protein COZ39_00450 [Candidatus Roizmanbacteria bacterium CG_4_10_14_